MDLAAWPRAHRIMVRELDNLLLYVLCNVNPVLRDQVGDVEKVAKENRYQDLGKLIADPSVDAVISAVPNFLHGKSSDLSPA